MKRIYFLSLICLLLAIVSCQKELGNDSGSGTGTVDTTSGGSGTGTTTSDCRSCSYFPLCNGSRYTFNDTLFGGLLSVIVDTFQLIKDTLIGGKTYQKIYSPASKSNNYFNCTNGVTTLKAYNAALVSGNTISAVTVTALKANLPVNGNWKDTLANPAGQTIIYDYTIKAKGISRTINGLNFSDVIYLYTEVGLEVPGFGLIVTNTSEYYYAKGVGLVESLSLDFMTGMVIDHRTITKYFIP